MLASVGNIAALTTLMATREVVVTTRHSAIIQEWLTCSYLLLGVRVTLYGRSFSFVLASIPTAMHHT